MRSLPSSETKPTGAPASVATSVSSPAKLRGERLLVVGGRGPGLLLRLAVVVAGQLLDAGAEDLGEQRRVRRQERTQARSFGMARGAHQRAISQCGAVLGVLEHDAHRGELVADAVGFGQFLRLAGGVAGSDQARLALVDLRRWRSMSAHSARAQSAKPEQMRRSP